MRRILALAAVILLLGSAAYAAAQRRHCGRCGRQRRQRGRGHGRGQSRRGGPEITTCTARPEWPSTPDGVCPGGGMHTKPAHPTDAVPKAAHNTLLQ